MLAQRDPEREVTDKRGGSAHDPDMLELEDVDWTVGLDRIGEHRFGILA